MSSSLPQTSRWGSLSRSSAAFFALARVRPTLLVLALHGWLLRRLIFANEKAPELQSVADSGQLGFRHDEL
eukprot:4843018-Alexandrium_andersonii.AAC.1